MNFLNSCQNSGAEVCEELWCYSVGLSTRHFGYPWISVTCMDYEKTQTVGVI